MVVARSNCSRMEVVTIVLACEYGDKGLLAEFIRKKLASSFYELPTEVDLQTQARQRSTSHCAH